MLIFSVATRGVARRKRKITWGPKSIPLAWFVYITRVLCRAPLTGLAYTLQRFQILRYDDKSKEGFFWNEHLFFCLHVDKAKESLVVKNFHCGSFERKPIIHALNTLLHTVDKLKHSRPFFSLLLSTYPYWHSVLPPRGVKLDSPRSCFLTASVKTCSFISPFCCTWQAKCSTWCLERNVI